MEIKISSKQILNALYVLSWILFVGLCIEAGGFLTNTIYIIGINPSYAENFWGNIDFSALLKFDSGHFLVVTFYMIIVTVLKALLFYLIIVVLHDKKLNMKQPFNNEIRKFISNMAYISLFIGFFSLSGKKYVTWIELQNVFIPNFELLKIGGADVWIFMGIVLLVIAQIFKRGIEIQQENDLTI